MTGRFYCVDTFGIPRRGLFVLAGNVSSGDIRQGMEILIPCNTGDIVVYPIISIEFINTVEADAKLGLMINPKNEADWARLRELRFGDREFEIVEPKRHPQAF